MTMTMTMTDWLRLLVGWYVTRVLATLQCQYTSTDTSTEMWNLLLYYSICTCTVKPTTPSLRLRLRLSLSHSLRHSLSHGYLASSWNVKCKMWNVNVTIALAMSLNDWKCVNIYMCCGVCSVSVVKTTYYLHFTWPDLSCPVLSRLVPFFSLVLTFLPFI